MNQLEDCFRAATQIFRTFDAELGFAEVAAFRCILMTVR
jgi:hypothetical protein